jgi:hypothetical protein
MPSAGRKRRPEVREARPLPSDAFAERDTALYDVGVHVDHASRCECCGMAVWLIELQSGMRYWANIVPADDKTELAWIEHDRDYCDRARARRRAVDLVKYGGRRRG